MVERAHSYFQSKRGLVTPDGEVEVTYQSQQTGGSAWTGVLVLPLATAGPWGQLRNAPFGLLRTRRGEVCEVLAPVWPIQGTHGRS